MTTATTVGRVLMTTGSVTGKEKAHCSQGLSRIDERLLTAGVPSLVLGVPVLVLLLDHFSQSPE